LLKKVLGPLNIRSQILLYDERNTFEIAKTQRKEDKMEIKNKFIELYTSPSQPTVHVLACRELHSSFHMAANCYLENILHPVTLSSP